MEILFILLVLLLLFLIFVLICLCMCLLMSVLGIILSGCLSCYFRSKIGCSWSNEGFGREERVVYSSNGKFWK